MNRLRLDNCVLVQGIGWCGSTLPHTSLYAVPVAYYERIVKKWLVKITFLRIYIV